MVNIKASGLVQFPERVGDKAECDILAGEQGPSCSTLDQVSDFRLVYVRFIKQEASSSIYQKAVGIIVPKKKQPAFSHSPAMLSLPTNNYSSKIIPKSQSIVSTTSTSQNIIPKSLSVSAMLNLGKVIEKQKFELIDIYSFSLHEMSWSQLPKQAEILVSKEKLGEGGFRRAFKASIKGIPEFLGR
eukprot:gene6476-7215_t